MRSLLGGFLIPPVLPVVGDFVVRNTATYKLEKLPYKINIHFIRQK